MNDRDLQVCLDRVRQGDMDAATQIYRALSKPVYTVALRILRQREGAEDVTQDIFVRLFTAPPDSSVKSPRAWIFRMTRNLAIDALRTRHAPTSDSGLPEQAEEDEALVGTARQMDIARAMSHLSQTEREVVALHIDGELTFSQIADTVGLSPATVYRTYRRALRCLRDELA